MYPLVLFAHSWLRWLVLAAALGTALRAGWALRAARPWARGDERARALLRGVVDLQFVLGLTLYLWLSPLVRAAFRDLGAAMRSAPLRFFAIEHILAMGVAVGIMHAYTDRMRRAASDRARHRSMLVASLGLSIMVLIGIPWPGLKQARPLARTRLPVLGEEGAATGQVPLIYQSRCAACHGDSGHGDGPAAQAMEPRPRDFRDLAFQRANDDAALRTVIRQGGAARGRSTNMPAHPDLSDADVAALVGFIRQAPVSAADR